MTGHGGLQERTQRDSRPDVSVMAGHGGLHTGLKVFKRGRGGLETGRGGLQDRTWQLSEVSN
ncbi:unnamed protein product, partial [Nesidiocoris tenuis]